MNGRTEWPWEDLEGLGSHLGPASDEVLFWRHGEDLRGWRRKQYQRSLKRWRVASSRGTCWPRSGVLILIEWEAAGGFTQGSDVLWLRIGKR